MKTKMNLREDSKLSIEIENLLIDHLIGYTVGPIRFDNNEHVIRVARHGTVHEIAIRKAFTSSN